MKLRTITWSGCIFAVGLGVACNLGVTPSDSSNTTTDQGGGDNSGVSGLSGVSLAGQIVATGGAARAAADALPTDEGFLVMAQSAVSGEIYQGVSDADGKFEVDIPDSENGGTFMVTIIKPDGRAAGPVLFDESAGEGMTGLDLSRPASLGTLVVPGDVADGPVVVGGDADTKELVSPEIVTRLDADGIPVGLASAGKGADAQGGGGGAGKIDSPQSKLDADGDGLPDVVDADDNGNGIVDEFDGAGDAGGIPAGAGIRLNFFMNLKISDADANKYYTGTADQVSDALKTDTIITLEIAAEPDAKRKPVAARVLTAPAPEYLSLMEKMGTDEHGGQSFKPWSDSDYAFDVATDRLQAFVRPNALLNAGDTFTVAVEFDDGSTKLFSRMINYVFKNIPRLRQFGDTVGGLTAFSSGTISFDGSQDLVLVFNPPTDDTGAYLTGMDYQFEIFYNDAGGAQLNGNIDGNATFPTPVAGFSTNNFSFNVTKDALSLAGDNTSTVTLPKDIFVSTVQTTSGAQAVGSYKIDIAAQKGGNAAIMLNFVKH